MRQLEINFENVENATIVINPIVQPVPVAVVQKPHQVDARKVLCRTKHGTLYERLKNGQLEVIFHFPPRYHEAEVADMLERESRAIVQYLDEVACNYDGRCA